MKWQQAKGQLIMAHYNWIKSVLRQMNEVVKPCLKNWHYLDEAIEFCNKAGLQLTEAEIIKTILLAWLCIILKMQLKC